MPAKNTAPSDALTESFEAELSTLPDRPPLREIVFAEQSEFFARTVGMNLTCAAIRVAWVSQTPRGKPTMTQRSKWTARNQDYLKNYCEALRVGFNRTTKFESADAIQVISVFATEQKKLFWRLQQKKPDASNILKGVEDALLLNDQSIGYAESLKIYGPESGLLITLINARS